MAKVEPGTVVGGKYRLDAPIGEGGMASVWRATHTTLEHPVAVKFLELYGSGREKMIERFFREAKLAAHLKHRNLVQILDFGSLEGDGQPFMVMELLQGESLGARLDQEEAPDEVAMLEIVAQLLGGLAAVHDAGIVHRDVKPDNVFLVRDADGEYPKLLDFGVSRSQGSARVTDTGAVVGTPAFMSPEQARGADDLDARTDLFSTGLVLYEMFAGQLPFESPRMGEMLIRVATEDMPTLATYRPDLPPSVIELVDRSVRRDRDARWPDARSMREALLAAADELATSPRRGSRPVRLPSDRHPGTDPNQATAISAVVPIPPEPGPAPSSRALVVGAIVGAILLGSVGAVAGAFLLRGDPPPPPVSAPPPAGPAPGPASAGSPAAVEAPAAPAVDPAPVVEAPAAPEPPPEVALEPEEAEPPGEEPIAEAGGAARAPARGGRRRPRPVAIPTPRPLAPAPAARPAPSPQPSGRGGFLRELDY